MRKLAAIMFTDIVGYTTLMSVDEKLALALLQRNRDLHKPLIAKHNGAWLKEIGDGTLASFDSAVDAVNCALEIQKNLRDDPDLVLRIGIHVGDVLFENEDVFGDGVNVASRLEPLAPEGGICVSQAVYDAIKNKSEITTQDLGEQSLKGLAEPVKIFIVSEGASTRTRPTMATRMPATLHRFNWQAITGGVLALLLVYWLANRVIDGTGTQPRLGDRSVAVLPFTNLSGQAGDEFFSDGITDVILTHLAKISDLKVISRTSIMQYKGTQKTTTQIARELGVASILEGSVQRSGDRIRIVSQLIDAQTDGHLWAETFDRQMADIFAIQSEVAQQIARALKAKLLPEEEQRLNKRPTDNLEAYEWYLRGNDYLRTASVMIMGGKTELQQAVKVYQQALKLDPEFAAAHARLSYTYTAQYFYHEQSQDVARNAKAAVDRALELDATLPEAYIALGYYHNLVNRNYDESLEAYSTARISLRGSSEVMAEIAHVQMRQGQWDQALDNFRRAAELDPRSAGIQDHLANIYTYLRRYTEAEKTLDYSVTLAPDVPGVYANQVALALLSGGGIAKARKIIQAAAVYTDPVRVLGLGSQLINRLGFWRYGLLDLSPEEIMQTVSHTYPRPRNQFYFFSMAQIHAQAKQPEMSLAYYDSARVWLESRLAGSPDNFVLQADMGLAMAFLGRKGEAIQACQRSKELMPISACHW